MEDIRTKSENTTPRQRAAAQIPKEAMRQLWLRSKEKGRTEIESTADGQQEDNIPKPIKLAKKFPTLCRAWAKALQK